MRLSRLLLAFENYINTYLVRVYTQKVQTLTLSLYEVNVTNCLRFVSLFFIYFTGLPKLEKREEGKQTVYDKIIEYSEINNRSVRVDIVLKPLVRVKYGLKVDLENCFADH